MKRMTTIALALLLILSLLCTGCGGTTAPKEEPKEPTTSEKTEPDAPAKEESGITEKINMTFSCGDADDYYMVVYLNKWAEKVEERSNGMIDITIVSNGQLGTGAEAFEQLEMGTIHAYMDGDFTPTAVDPAWNVFAMPYLFEDYDHQHNFFENYFDDAADHLAEVSGIRPVGVMDGINRNTTLNYEAKSLADLKGAKLRVPQIDAYVNIWNALGAAPIGIGFYEIYTSIQTGVVNGQENDVSLSYSMGFHEVAPYIIMTEHAHYCGCIFMSEDYWQSLPQAARDIINETSKEIYAETVEYCATLETDTLAKLEEEGATIIYPDLEEFKSATTSLYDNLDENAEFVYDLVKEAAK